MSSRKRKIVRQTSIPVLVFTEGLADKNFLQAFRSLLNCSRKYSYNIVNGTGGAPYSIVRKASKHMESKGYEAGFVLMDTDKPWDDATMNAAQKANLVLIGSSPHCIEGMLLRWTDCKQPNSSSKCKAELENTYKAPYKYQTSRYFEDICKTLMGNRPDCEVYLELESIFTGKHKELPK
ncbi:MAG: hypothetical protein AXW14_12785 [Alteromonas sp. Nap_26]|nr:MAG: hypothetical protein AXW14_12785 [Alteromonas sp. Nap_26]